MAKAMIEQTITQDRFMDMVLTAYPRPEADKKGAVSKWDTKVQLIEDIYTGEFNHTIAGTAWGALNAMTERLDWHRSARKGNSESILAGASGFDPVVNAEKNRLKSVVTQMAFA